MRTVPLESDALRIRGALDFDRTQTGISPLRLPAWTRTQISDLMTPAVSALPSGVRLEFVTDADKIELDVQITQLVFSDRPSQPAAFDLVVDGEMRERAAPKQGRKLHLSLRTREFKLVDGRAPTLQFGKLGSASKLIEIWLPANANVELRALRIPEGASISRAQEGTKRRWMHYGSSISHGMEAEGPTGTWPVVAARVAGVDVHNLGLGGSAHLDQFAARTMRDLPADAISIKCGINVANANSLTERTFGPALHGFLDTVRDGHPDTPLLVVSPIICPMVEDHPGPTVMDAKGMFYAVPRPPELMEGCLTLRRIREIIADAVQKRRDAGDAHLHALDGLQLFGPDDVRDLPDGLHPNAAGYSRIGERFAALAFGARGPLA